MTTSRTSPERSRARSGFTLLELLLVVTMMAVLSAVALPRISSLAERTRLDEGAEELARVVRFAWMESIRRGLKIRLEFDTGGGKYRLRVQDRSAAYRESFIPFEDPYLDSWVSVPKHVHVSRVVTADGRAAPTQITFHPIGSVSVTEIELRDISEDIATIILGALPGEVHVRTSASEMHDGEVDR